jgi:hypothetical protein
MPPLKGLGETHGQLILPELVLPAMHVPPQRTLNLKVELKEEKGKTVTRLLVLGSRATTATTLYVDNPSGWVVLHSICSGIQCDGFMYPLHNSSLDR